MDCAVNPSAVLIVQRFQRRNVASTLVEGTLRHRERDNYRRLRSGGRRDVKGEIASAQFDEIGWRRWDRILINVRDSRR